MSTSANASAPDVQPIDPRTYAKAILNILADSTEEQARLQDNQSAILNILEDSEAEKLRLAATQRAVLNILEDVDTERNERKEAEAKVRALNEQLEARVAQRTAALQAANEELESFAYSVSHDLRAPLRAINGFSQVLLEDCNDALGDAGRDALRRVRQASQRMDNLIEDMLKLSRSTRGSTELVPVDLSAIAHKIAAALKQAAPEREIRVAIQPAVIGLGDGRLLETVLENLFTNAWKFTSKTGGAWIEFSGEARGRELVCCVRDNGAGFDMAFAHNLFVPFQRLHHPSEFPGNGIGLATVKRIVARMGGRVWAEAAVSRGAAFYFTLSRVPEPNREEQSERGRVDIAG
jgi:light-regulated signal transduction histidine kinase (bacteriophytochrome)